MNKPILIIVMLSATDEPMPQFKNLKYNWESVFKDKHLVY